MSLQLIDENKDFNNNLEQFFQDLGIGNNGLNYHVVSVFGSQSTGKSTLLNALFNTKFNVMDETQRQQTTKGIWMARSSISDNTNNSDILVMDVEGTDGRERGEDQDFERKSALFALATSEVLIVNMWENQVGLYQGANMGLLKTVFEVNLSLFQASKNTTAPRSAILFVIRDHIGHTPLANLSATLINDLTKAWDSIAKPDSLKDSKFEDFFDVKFEALPHKLLMPEKFNKDSQAMANKFNNGDYFKSEYHRNVPLDGWNMYAANIWEQIEQNKDLDLPTQQILVARFRCGEISTQAIEQFNQELNKITVTLGDPDIVVEHFGNLVGNARNGGLEYYDSLASRYTTSVYQGQRLDLIQQIDTKLINMFNAQITALHKWAISNFVTTEFDKSEKFGDEVNAAKNKALELFETGAAEAASVDSNVFVYDRELKNFKTELSQEERKIKGKEIDRLVHRGAKHITQVFDEELESYFTKPDENTWDKVMDFFNNTLDAELESRAPRGEFKNVNSPDDLNEVGINKLKIECWTAFDKKLHEITMPTNILSILKDHFDTKFKYNKSGIPVVWTAHDDIETPFIEARDASLKLVPIFTTAKTTTKGLVTPDVTLEDYSEDPSRFAKRINSVKRDEVIEKFKRQADTSFVDAKRSTTSSATQIPWYMFLLLILLGWNEFMAVLRNPFLFLFVLLVGAGAWITWTMGLMPTVIQVSTAAYDRSVELAKEKLRQVVHEQPNNRQSEEIEMKNL